MIYVDGEGGQEEIEKLSDDCQKKMLHGSWKLEESR
jgi:hypothetical protein